MPEFIRIMQNKLFNIGAYLATPVKGGEEPQPHGLAEADVQKVEQMIDQLDAKLPPMQGFILPGGSRISVLCDVCRTITRRAERRVVSLAREQYVAPVVLQYLNRMSDFFFAFARFNNVTHQFEEVLWDKNA